MGPGRAVARDLAEPHRTAPHRPEHQGPEDASMPRTHTLTAAIALVATLPLTLDTLAPASRAQAPTGPGGGPPPGMMGMGMGMGMRMPGMGGGQGGPLMILLAPSVQKELKLTDDQKSKVNTFVRAESQKYREAMRTMAMSMGGGNANPQMMMETFQKRRQETDQGIAKILDPKQKERLDQIGLRVEGPMAVARPEIAEKLGLKETQKQYIQELVFQMGREMAMTIRQGMATGQLDPSQVPAMTAQFRANAEKEIGQALDAKQKASFNKLLGAPFDVKSLDAETAKAETDLESSPTSETPEAKDAAKAESEKEAGKPAASPARKKGRTTKSGANR
jgi:hypothetical protein